MARGAPFRPIHIDRIGEFTLDLPLGHAFPLFSPEGERAWVPGWDPDYSIPIISNAAGTLLRTTHNGEETLWLVLTYSPRRRSRGLPDHAPLAHRHGTGPLPEEGPAGPGGRRHLLTGAQRRRCLPPDRREVAAMLQDWQAMITASQKARPGA
jgi:hypothetical protein